MVTTRAETQAAVTLNFALNLSDFALISPDFALSFSPKSSTHFKFCVELFGEKFNAKFKVRLLSLNNSILSINNVNA
jgi:hypothetical protein